MKRMGTEGVMQRLIGVCGMLVCLAAGANSIVPDGPNTQVNTAPNGAPVVNIAPANQAGISHNTYQQFNVPQPGAVLNNSARTVETFQAGRIAGNPNVAARPAEMIINEVTHPNPSQLRGVLEVAGPTANVVVANPWGITCNGCGFINIPNATLTTGRPQFGLDGDLQRYRVEGGEIIVEGGALNAANMDPFSILTRALKVNADIHTKHLQVILGANEIDAVTHDVSPIAATGPRPRYALDVAQIGGMYANKIRLIGTEQGLGVNYGGKMHAPEVNITLDGSLTVSDKVDAEMLDISLGQHEARRYSFENIGHIEAKGKISMVAGQVQNRAGAGGYDVHVEGHTELIGAGMNSTAIPEHNRLDTGTLHTADINNTASYSAGQSGISVSFSMQGKQGSDAASNAGQNAAGTGANPANNAGSSGFNLGKDAAGSLKNTLVQNMLPKEADEANSQTRSAIAPGEVTIRDAEGQLAKTGQSVEETLAGLNCDTESAHQPLEKIFNKDDVARRQEKSRVIGNIVQQAAPLLYEQVGDVLKDSSAEAKAAVHGLIGGALSAALGGDVAAGAVGVAVTSLVVEKLDQQLIEQGVSQENRQAILLLVSGAVGKVSGVVTGADQAAGNVAGFVAMEATEYNYLSHRQEKQRDLEIKQCGSELCRMQIRSKWGLVSSSQDAAFITGAATSVPDTLVKTVEGVIQIVKDPVGTYEGFKQLLNSDDVLGTVGRAVQHDFQQRLARMEMEYERAGPDGAYYAGLEFGRIVTDFVCLATAGAGLAKSGVNLAEKIAGSVTKRTGTILTNGAGKSSSVAGKSAAQYVRENIANDFIKNPQSIWGKTADDIAKDFQTAGYKVNVRQSTRGSKQGVIIEVEGHPEINQVQAHPGGGRHDGSYYKVSTTTQGVVKVVDPSTYRHTPGEKATIVHKSKE